MRISVRWKLLAPILVSGVVICLIAHHMIVDAAVRQVEALSVRDARTMSQYVAHLRAYYTANVVADAKAMGMKISHEHANDANAIPLPATMVHELNALIHEATDSANHTTVRLFSPYPFPWRKDGGIKSVIDQEEWDALSRDPTRAAVRTVDEGGQLTIRYATADTMRVPACVGCHNSHPQSPKHDWKLGDTRGVLVISVPMGATMSGARADANRATWMIVGIVVLLIAATMGFAQRSLFAPMRELGAVARQIAAGDLTGSVRYRANDEIGDVADSFRSATNYLDGVSVAVTKLGRGELDQTLVPASEHDVVSRSVNLANVELRQRAERLLARNADMRLVLDNVAQGLITVGLDGRMSPECSAVVKRWFGDVPEPKLLWDYLAPSDLPYRDWLRLIWESLSDGELPIEVLIDPLPKWLRHGELHIGVEYLPICKPDGQLDQVLVVLSDITERVEAERVDAQQKELLGVFKRMLSDRSGTLEFLSEVDDIVTRIAEGRETDAEELARLVHTVKGNCAIFDVVSVSRLCHELEERAKESGQLSDADRVLLKDAWASFSERVGGLLGSGANSSAILVDPHDYDGFLDQLVQGVPRSDLAREITRWRLDRVQPRLERLGEQARLMAHRLGKAVDVEVEPTTLRVSAEASKTLWLALVHAVRNAIDHGIESAEERERASKVPAGKLTLRAVPSAHHVTIEIEDDGRGIDWEAIRGRAASMGLPSESRGDLIDAMFAAGLSTKCEATELSGRGVGMSALRAVINDLDGHIDITSQPGAGTLVRVSIPVEEGTARMSRRRIISVTR
jgi:HAMP domain-containing protein/HPt (histidine-containing phosphotransfer) domain-containing protein